MSKKYIYYFSEGNDAFGGDKTTMKNILGGKGSGLAEMTAAGMPVPQGFTITTEACTQYYADGRQLNDALVADIFEHVKGLEKITFVLDWTPNTNHTGMYVALYKGWYEEEGLNVEIIEPTEGATATLIAVGKGDFGISYQEEVTMALTSEDPLPIRAVAAIIQHNTSGFATWAGKDITSPADFGGKTYSCWGGPGEAAVINAVMTEAGADFDTLNIVISDGSGFAALEGDVDIMWFYEAWDNIKCELAGFDINYMPVRDLDERLDYYTPLLITSTDVIENRPEMVRKFLAATSRGYVYAIENPDECAEILGSYVPDYDMELLYRSQNYLADKYMADVDRWGEMNDEVWDRYTQFLVDYDVIDEPIAAADCYTNEFLPEA